ncbi:ribosome biogenesis protein SLX9-domain-containing protein [Pseudoneurospora amorphoporcata]|uniref:Ribosome biogenesis protein SLX9 n=1 Tax=Pseudoneurospora amorphoporcata TaxID=241081 RepID=A0AAN6NX07_9PEZI|nr:ribosome biogenesis protein SLX9-domain-containing protein [Pseudoneurospora amorphoporcata]
MAPTAPTPGKRLSAREKALKRLADPLLPRKLHRENNVVSDSFIDSKKDKRTIKHNAFVSRIAKATPGSGKINKKRRRPSKKLVASLESLGDVLGEISDEMREDQESGKTMDKMQEAMGRVRHKSLKTRPGALKRKEKVVKTEMDRFGRSLAQLATVKEAPGQAAVAAPVMEVEQQQTTQGRATQTATTTQQQQQQPVTTNRWAVLRGFISATMEQNPAFLGKTA